MNTKRFKLGLVAAVAALLALCGCSEQAVTLPAAIDLLPGQSYALSGAARYQGEQVNAAEAAALLQAADTTEPITLEIISDAPDIVTTDANGLLTAVAPGTATVTVRCAALAYEAAVEVTVAEPAAAIVTEESVALAVGESHAMQTVTTPAGAVVRYRVEHPDVAYIDETGLLTGLTDGQTTVIAQVPGSSLTARCAVTVEQTVQSISLTRAEATLPAGQRMVLGAAVVGANAPVQWQSSDPTVAAVDASGMVTAGQTGVATISAAAGGQRAECIVTVTTAPATPETATATPETAVFSATAETAATPETAPRQATPETATPEQAATPETATAETAATPEAATVETAAQPTPQPTVAPTPAPQKRSGLWGFLLDLGDEFKSLWSDLWGKAKGNTR